MRKVMIAEDEADIREGLANLIEWEAIGMEIVHKAANGKEALAMWKQQPVDIVVTDLRMPDMDGLELLENIRREDKRACFIILSGYDDFDDARTAIRLKVDNYILKPVSEDELEKAVLECAEKLETIENLYRYRMK